jgi:hypothetical protein
MTIKSVRIYYYPTTKRRQLWLTSNYWGFAEWFERRLKPRQEHLRGDEVKGVDIVNLMLYENPSHAWRPNQWARRINTLEFSYVCDLRPLEQGDKVKNLELLMQFYAHLVQFAPWPQMEAVKQALAEPLSESDKSSLLPYLQWPRKVGYAAKFL